MNIEIPTTTASHTNGATQPSGVDALEWLADQGATFALPRGRTKGNDKATGKSTFEKGWQNAPKTLEQALAHADRGGNVGLLVGKHSNNIVALDRDVDYPETIAMLGPLARTAKIVRDNAPDRGKLLYRIVGDLPKTTSWIANPTDEHPAAEFLSTGRHAIIPPSEYDGGHYQLIDQEFGILEVAPEEIDKIWWMITGEHLDKNQRKTADRPTDNGDFVERVRNAWTTEAIFAHFNRNGNGTVEGRAETRLLGNGGLLVNEWRWYCHSAGVGGDQFDAWAYCRWGRVINRNAPAQFWDVVNEMADAAGIERPGRKTASSATKPATRAATEDDDTEPEVESGAVLAALLEDVRSQDTSDLTAFKKWLIDQVGAMALLSGGDLTRLAIELRGRGIPNLFFRESLMPLIAEERDDQQVETGKQADKLIKLAKEHARFFSGRGDSQLYASVKVDGHTECYRLKSDKFNDWLSSLYYSTFGTTVNAQARADAKSVLAFGARNTIEDVFIRVGHHMGKTYVDIGSPEHDAYEIDSEGWRIVAEPPVNFRRSDHMLPLPLAIRHDDLLILHRFLNIEENEWPLVAGWLVAATHPRGPYPVLGLLSRAGSGKSTQLRVLKRLLDPSSAELRALPTDVRELFISAANSWALCFDNVSTITPEIADALCVIATGGAFTKRTLHSDGDEQVFNVQRPVALNGIGDVITRADLMDRAIIIATPFIPEDERKEEGDFWQEFEQDRPKILGALLFALSTAVANINSIKLEKKPRMADFAKIAVAAESAYSDGKYGFLDAYTSNRNEAAETIIENSPVGDVLRRLVAVNGNVKWTPAELFERINKEAKEYEKNARSWPTAPNRLKSVIERIAPALVKNGVEVTHAKNNGERVYSLKRLSGEGR